MEHLIMGFGGNRRVLAVAGIAGVSMLLGCTRAADLAASSPSSVPPDRGATVTTTTVTPTTRPVTTSTTMPAAPATGPAAPRTDQMPQTDLTKRFSRPQQAAAHLYEAWRAGNRSEALKSGVPEAVDQLFSFAPPRAGLTPVECENLGPEGFACDWAGERLHVMMRVNGGASVGYRVVSVVVSPRNVPPRPIDPTFIGIWPESTEIELERAQAEVDQGHRPWRLDPVEVARAYLASLGLVDVELAPYVAADERRGRVAYRAGATNGRVHLARLAAGGISFVVSSDTASATIHEVMRQGNALRVTAEHAPGTLRIAARPLATRTWLEGDARMSDTASLSTLTVELPDADVPVLLRLQHQAPDGTSGIGELRV